MITQVENPVLEIHDLTVSYDQNPVLWNVDLSLPSGKLVGILGPNGAGKSTCFACLAGQQRAKQGSVTWRDQNLMHVPAESRRGMGVARTFQVAQVFEALSVFQNLQLALNFCSRSASDMGWSTPPLKKPWRCSNTWPFFRCTRTWPVNCLG